EPPLLRRGAGGCPRRSRRRGPRRLRDRPPQHSCQLMRKLLASHRRTGSGPDGRSGSVSRADLHEGLAFAEAARARAEAGTSAATQSWVAGVEAEALCNLGNAAGAERALDRSRVGSERLRSEDEPPWLWRYDEAYLEGTFSSVYLALGRPAPARRAV